jgi:hypothetical protein
VILEKDAAAARELDEETGRFISKQNENRQNAQKPIEAKHRVSGDCFFHRFGQGQNLLFGQFIERPKSFAFKAALRIGRLVRTGIMQADEIDGQLLLHIEADGWRHTSDDVNGILLWQGVIKLFDSERK